ncbi:MAG TPA: thermonuclease family protein [Rhizomicrobium sp.]
MADQGSVIGGAVSWVSVGLALVATLRSGSAWAATAALPACLPPPAGDVQVTQVQDRGVLLLKDRRTVKLESLLWPSDSDGAAASLAQQARNRLAALVANRSVELRIAAPKTDRYGRLRAQVVFGGTADPWLQREILREGLARVAIAPDRTECATALYAAEAEARAAQRGLWAYPAYAIRTPESLRWRDLGTFQIVEGTVQNVAVRSSRGYLNFGRNWRTDFTIVIQPHDMKAFRAANVDPYSYANKTVRVHGWVDRLNGFEIEASSPAQIEFLK